jgi:hypothetical protein
MKSPVVAEIFCMKCYKVHPERGQQKCLSVGCHAGRESFVPYPLGKPQQQNQRSTTGSRARL